MFIHFYMERGGQSGELLQRQKNLILLDMTLQEIKRVSESPARKPEFQQEHLRRLGGTLWDALPQDVTTLNLGQDETISRSEDHLQRIPEHQRRTWDLPEVDQFASTVARAIGKPYTSKFPRK